VFTTKSVQSSSVRVQHIASIYRFPGTSNSQSIDSMQFQIILIPHTTLSCVTVPRTGTGSSIYTCTWYLVPVPVP